METQKIVNLLNGSDYENSKFGTNKWYVINSETSGAYSENEQIKFSTKSIESSLCDYSDACILVTENVRTTSNNNATQVASKNCEPFKDCRQINDTFVDYAGFINIAMPMYNLIEYSDNYSDTSSNLWHFVNQHPTSQQTSHIPHPTSQTFHIPNIPHPEHPTSQTF